MDPKEWGPYVWKYLHLLAATFPDEPLDETRKDFELLIHLIAKFLMCKKCSYHFSQYLEKHPIYPATASRSKLEKYFFDFHEWVNNAKEVPSHKRLNFIDVQKKYRSGQLADQSHSIVLIALIILSSVLFIGFGTMTFLYLRSTSRKTMFIPID